MKIICDKCKRDLNEIYQDNMSTNPLFCLCEDCAKKETEDFVMFDNSGIFTIDLKNEIWFDGKNILISPKSKLINSNSKLKNSNHEQQSIFNQLQKNQKILNQTFSKHAKKENSQV